MSPSADIGSTSRFGLPAAPAGLCLVQDLLNTRALHVTSGHGFPDLLAETSTASAWLKSALDTWSRQTGRPTPMISLTGKDLRDLRRYRDHLHAWVTDPATEGPELPAQILVRPVSGTVAYEARQDTAGGLLSLVCLELLLAGQTDRLARFRTCANTPCGAAFYDTSRNGRRVWHDPKTCGNVVNLRASRSRQKSGDATRS
ncbi:CGNR zinc finger domain-containing protein [Amycolatopsis sp. NPDC004169]|uniref:CGNR zinc finger domain-containing protein n=1 Tax=Amycolatopsis sp. NPDC004169 TaxID=3154453 RepID=UPI0033AFF3BC